MKFLAALLLLLSAPALAGTKTVTGTVVSPGVRALRDTDGTEHYPSFELRLPRWDAAGCYRADGTPAGISDLERVEIVLQENVHVWTWVTNASSTERSWWQLGAGSTSAISRASMEGVADPASTGLLCWEGRTVKYAAGGDRIAPNATESGYYWGPTPPAALIHVGDGDRAAINLWARPTPGLGNDVRRYVSPRAVQEWTADWSGHASWGARIEVGFAPQVTVRYVYRDVPSAAHRRAISGPWMRTPMGYHEDLVTETWPGLPAGIDPLRVSRVRVEHQLDMAVNYGIEDVSGVPGNCAGSGYAGSWGSINGSGHFFGTGFAFFVGGPPTVSFAAYDGNTDWRGASGLLVRPGRWFSTGEIVVHPWDTANPVGHPEHLDAWLAPWLSTPTIEIEHTRIPASGLYPQGTTPGAVFEWDGRLALAPETRVTWFVDL